MQSMSPSKNDPAVGKANLKSENASETSCLTSPIGYLLDTSEYVFSQSYISLGARLFENVETFFSFFFFFFFFQSAETQSVKSQRYTFATLSILEFSLSLYSLILMIVSLSNEINIRLLKIRSLSRRNLLRVNIKQNVFPSCSSTMYFVISITIDNIHIIEENFLNFNLD